MTPENSLLQPSLAVAKNKLDNKPNAKKLEKFSLSQAWFLQHGWQPFPFQKQVWQAVAKGQSGMLHATTGAGKTYAVWMAAIESFATKKLSYNLDQNTTKKLATKRKQVTQPLTVLWITPMRALAADTERALMVPVNELSLDWSVGLRTGDTTSSERARQSKRLPTALITTAMRPRLILPFLIS